MEKAEKNLIVQKELWKSSCMDKIKIIFKRSEKSIRIINPKQAFNLVFPFFNKKTIRIKEEFLIVLFDNNSYVLGWFKLSPKGASKITINSKIIFFLALKRIDVNSILIAHNRLSEDIDIYPKKNERAIINCIYRTGKLLNVYLFDHLIVSPGKFCYSLNYEKTRKKDLENGGGFE